MQAVKDNTEYTQQFPIDSDTPAYSKKINAKKLWDKIIHNAWKAAEPGILFWDKIAGEAIPDHYADYGFTTISTNPCGEIPLCPYDSCRLLALNLFGYVDQPFTKKAKFNYEKFKVHARLAQRIMDDIVDLEIEKIDRIIEKIENDPEADEVKSTELNLWLKIREKSIQGRRIGVGITAEGDMLAALGIRYGSDKGIELSTEVHKVLAVEAYRSSVHMARDRGAFPIYETIREKDNPFINRIKDADPELYKEMEKYGRRNISMLTIAPTGTTSLMAQTTSGIEPVFMVSYKRRRKVNPNDQKSRIDFIDETGDSWEEYNVFHHNFLVWLELNGYDVDQVTKMNDADLKKIITKSPYHQSTANDVNWVSKVNMQGEVQKWVDHSISVTVNVPKDVKEEMVSDIYLAGWESGCKGITVYRDGSRSGVLISNDKKEKEDNGFVAHNAPKRPKKLKADVVRFYNDKEKWIAIIGIFKDRPYEIFTGRAEDSFSILSKVDSGWVIKNRNGDGKARYDFQYEDKDGYKITIEGLSRTFNKEYHNYARLISGVLRHGMPLVYAVDMVSNLHLDEATLNTWKNGVVRTLKRYVPNGTVPVENQCPECGEGSLVYEEGCLNCKSCGHSKCG
jgi:ribonucleoside-diphosphate reductase alpha chain